MTMQTRWYQSEAVDALFGYFQHFTGNPIIAMPTGTGKSVVIAQFIERVLRQWPGQRFIIATHVKELVGQNAARLLSIWPQAPVGIYSAGLGRSDTAMPITFAGIASIAGKEPLFGRVDLFLIDEAHLLSPKEGTMYQQVIANLKRVNPYLKVIGFTATPYRLGLGLLTNGGIFTDIAYDITGMAAFNRLIYEGYLSPPVTKKTNVEFDLSAVKLEGGEYQKSSLEKTVNTDAMNEAVVRETCYFGGDRNAWLVFASGVKHAELLAEMFQAYGVQACAVHSKLKDKDRDRRIEAFMQGGYRCVVNQNVLTTGFDYPAIDLIAAARATMSTGLWVQMVGRGTRPSPGKRDCLVLDFAGNTRRLGPINDPVIPREKGKGPPGDPPVRICPMCSMYNHASARVCFHCGHEFTFETKLLKTASTDEILRSDAPQTETIAVTSTHYAAHNKPGSPTSLRVTYYCGLNRYDEWVLLEHTGIGAKRARDWWRLRWTRDASDPPATVIEALSMTSQLRQPKYLTVVVNRKYPEITGYEF
jgi:DNA repair protein RadD